MKNLINIFNEKRNLFKIIQDPKKKKLQLKYVRLIAMSQIICILFLFLCFNVLLRVILKSSQLGRYAELQLSGAFYIMNWLFVGVMIISISAGIILSLGLSHKFVGPLYRIENTLRNYLEGMSSSGIKIRDDDELHDLAQILSKILN